MTNPTQTNTRHNKPQFDRQILDTTNSIHIKQMICKTVDLTNVIYFIFYMMFGMPRICRVQFLSSVQGLSCLSFVCLGIIVSSVCLSKVGYGTKSVYLRVLDCVCFCMCICMSMCVCICVFMCVYVFFVSKKLFTFMNIITFNALSIHISKILLQNKKLGNTFRILKLFHHNLIFIYGKP